MLILYKYVKKNVKLCEYLMNYVKICEEYKWLKWKNEKCIFGMVLWVFKNRNWNGKNTEVFSVENVFFSIILVCYA